MPGQDRYWTVELHVFAFETKEEAIAYRERLEEAWEEMPESRDYGASTKILEEQV